MKKIFTLLTLLITVLIFSQDFVLTETNYKLKPDLSKDYVVLYFPDKNEEALFNLVQKNIKYKFKTQIINYQEIQNEQIIVDVTSLASRTIYINKRGSNVWKVVNRYELNFKNGKIMVRPYFLKLINEDLKTEVSLGNFFNSRGIVRLEHGVEFAELLTNSFVRTFNDDLIENKKEDW
ncbi:hypothetical protein [Chryseobacterium indologenes]|nr:hypothetical protein [Chryseobacterium indologenes]